MNTVVNARHRRIKKGEDGNVAFKVTYVDTNWSGICSREGYAANLADGRIWCNIQGESGYDCQDGGDVDEDTYPCLDSVALKTLRFSPGMTHGEKVSDTPKMCLNAKVGKLVLFTSRKPGELENTRFIFAVGKIAKIQDPDESDNGMQMFHCNKETALKFSKLYYPKFWDYHNNPNKMESISWATGLFRYISDATVKCPLEDVLKNRGFSERSKQAANKLIEAVR